jgi:hypothetical protein
MSSHSGHTVSDEHERLSSEVPKAASIGAKRTHDKTLLKRLLPHSSMAPVFLHHPLHQDVVLCWG